MAKKDPQTQKTALLAGLREVRHAILELASSLAPEQREEVYLGTWSVREMLAHLAGWDAANLRAAGEVQGGELPSFYQHTGKDWSQYNALLVEQYSREDCEELLDLVRSAQQELLAELEALPAEELYRDCSLRAKGWMVTIARLLEAELKDEKEHLEQLRMFVEEGIKS
jgi:hypothetical protein